MSNLHHAAFDRQIIGVQPDHVVEVRRDVLEEINGPMLQLTSRTSECQHMIERYGLTSTVRRPGRPRKRSA